jgi:hypothetical protein
LRLDGLIDTPLPELYDELVENVWRGLVPKASGRILQAVSE